MKKFYVYEHWRLDRDECFYVGKGKGGRAYKMRDRNSHHQAIMAKLSREGSGMEVRMVATGLTEDEAFLLEVERISFWRGLGIDLANQTYGGEGVSGLAAYNRKKVMCVTTGEEFVSASAAAIKFGFSASSISDACRGRSESANGIKFLYVDSPELAKDSRLSAKKRKKVNKPKSYFGSSTGLDVKGRKSTGPKKLSKTVICLDTGETFPSASEAARHFNVCKSSLIELCLGKNGRRAVGGLKFAYGE
jgi:hypothetical protein